MSRYEVHAASELMGIEQESTGWNIWEPGRHEVHAATGAGMESDSTGWIVIQHCKVKTQNRTQNPKRERKPSGYKLRYLFIIRYLRRCIHRQTWILINFKLDLQSYTVRKLLSSSFQNCQLHFQNMFPCCNRNERKSDTF